MKSLLIFLILMTKIVVFAQDEDSSPRLSRRGFLVSGIGLGVTSAMPGGAPVVQAGVRRAVSAGFTGLKGTALFSTVYLRQFIQSLASSPHWKMFESSVLSGQSSQLGLYETLKSLQIEIHGLDDLSPERALQIRQKLMDVFPDRLQNSEALVDRMERLLRRQGEMTEVAEVNADNPNVRSASEIRERANSRMEERLEKVTVSSSVGEQYYELLKIRSQISVDLLTRISNRVVYFDRLEGEQLSSIDRRTLYFYQRDLIVFMSVNEIKGEALELANSMVAELEIIEEYFGSYADRESFSIQGTRATCESYLQSDET